MSIIQIYPAFFKDNQSKRDRRLVHELCHIITMPTRKAMAFLLDDKHVTWADCQARNEAETDHFANVVYALTTAQ